MITTKQKIIQLMEAAGFTPTGLSRHLSDAGIMSQSQAKHFLKANGGDTVTAKADAIQQWLINHLNQKGH